MDNISEKTFDNFKKITPALVAIALLTGMILFLPESILDKMGLSNLPDLWNKVIGLTFLLSVALIITLVVFSIISRIRDKRQTKRLREKLKKNLKRLSPRQKSIVVQLLHSEDKTISLDKNSRDTIYLVNSLFIYMPQQAFTLGWNNEMILTYVPQPWLLDLFNDEPELFN
ncbi:MAG: superinfection exclusion B family protein [Lachnobacterium sp.]|nr:superinfection exclusion B family protein [Lachnobacterium sp.]